MMGDKEKLVGNPINTRIKQIRKEHGLTQTEFGNRIGISNPSVSTIESGKNSPSGQTIKAICREFGINEEWLRTGEGERKSSTADADKLLVKELLAGDDIPFYQFVRKTLRGYMDLDADSKRVLNSILERIAKNENLD